MLFGYFFWHQIFFSFFSVRKKKSWLILTYFPGLAATQASYLVDRFTTSPIPLFSKNWTVRNYSTNTTDFLEGRVTHNLLDLWTVLTAHPQHQTHQCLLTAEGMKLWPVRNCHVQSHTVKQAHSPQPPWEAKVIITSRKYPLNPWLILQLVHLNGFVVSHAASKLPPCYLYFPISLACLEHYFTDTVTGLGVIPLGNQERSKCRAPAVTPLSLRGCTPVLAGIPREPIPSPAPSSSSPQGQTLSRWSKAKVQQKRFTELTASHL